MFFAAKEALLQQLCTLEIHRLRFSDIGFPCTEPPGAGREATRVRGEMIYAGAQPDDRIVAEKIASVVSQVQKL